MSLPLESRKAPSHQALTPTPSEPLAHSLAQNSENPPADPDLARLVEAWPNLPEPIRRAVLALVGSVR